MKVLIVYFIFLNFMKIKKNLDLFKNIRNYISCIFLRAIIKTQKEK